MSALKLVSGRARRAWRWMMPILVLHRSSGQIAVEPGSLVEYANDHGFNTAPAILDGDDCVKLLRDDDWVATAQAIAALNCAAAACQV